MNFDAILKYQQLDAQMVDLEKAFNNAPVVKEYRKAKDEFSVVAGQYKQLLEKFGEKEKELLEIEKELNKIENEINTPEIQEADYASSDDIKYPLNALNELASQLEGLENESKKISLELELISKKMPVVQKQGLEKQQERNNKAIGYKNAEKLKLDEIEKINKAKVELEPSIDTILLSTYKRAAQAGKTKIVFDTKVGDTVCKGCFRNLGNAVDRLRAVGDWMDCPECGVILIIR